MRKNVSNIDKSIRVFIALAVALLYYFDSIEGTLAFILMGVAIILLVTSLINFCPLYRILGFSTCKKKLKDEKYYYKNSEFKMSWLC